jgi:purine-nucleoside phosphorylase
LETVFYDKNVFPMTYEQAQETAAFIREKYDKQLQLALVLGSGLGAFADEIENAVRIPYADIPHFAQSTVQGHAGQLVLGEVEGIHVAVQQGRFHYYEGYDISQVIFPMRVFKLLGIESVILTNAAGSINTNFTPGSLMLIRDHVNMMGVNPLRGKNDERFGARFPDMTEVYSRQYLEKAIVEANAIGVSLRRGVYTGLSGPTYETPAEIHMLRNCGTDAVGMSTVPEAVAARHMGMKVLGISCITNFAAGIIDQDINHEEVMETGAQVAETFKELLRRIIPKLVGGH